MSSLSSPPLERVGYNVEQTVGDQQTMLPTPQGVTTVLGEPQRTTAVFRPESPLSLAMGRTPFVEVDDDAQLTRRGSTDEQGRSTSPTNSPSSPL